MNIDHLLNTACTITSVTVAGTVDVYGDPGEATTTTTTLCWLHPTGVRDLPGVETTGLDNIQAETYTVYFPAGTSIDGGDRVTVAGLAYEVQGPAWSATHPVTLGVEFVQATMKRVF